MKQMPYKSNIMQRDIKLPNWSGPRDKPQIPAKSKAKSALKKDIFSVLDIVVIVAVILVIKFLVHHVSINFH